MAFSPKDGFPYYYNLVIDKQYKPLFLSKSTFDFLRSISENKSNYRYAPGKWNIKQIIGHITDHERIKIYRAFLLSRQESVELWGYNQISLVENSRFEELPLRQLILDFANVRKASISFIEALSEKQLRIIGKAQDYEISLEEFLVSIIGHEKHHLEIIQKRYL